MGCDILDHLAQEIVTELHPPDPKLLREHTKPKSGRPLVSRLVPSVDHRGRFGRQIVRKCKDAKARPWRPSGQPPAPKAVLTYAHPRIADIRISGEHHNL